MTSPLTDSARHFRTFLTALLVLLAIGVTAAVFFSVKYINSYAGVVNQNHSAAANSESEINNIKTLAAQLSAQSTEVENVKKIVADSKSYQYQNVIINDLSLMAANAGVSITNYDFSTESSASSPPAATATPAAAPSATATEPASPSGTPAPAASTLKSTTVNVTLSNPVSYASFLNFLYYIQQNNTKMQISNLSLSLDTSGKIPDGVTTNALAIEVYIR